MNGRVSAPKKCSPAALELWAFGAIAVSLPIALIHAFSAKAVNPKPAVLEV